MLIDDDLVPWQDLARGTVEVEFARPGDGGIDEAAGDVADEADDGDESEGGPA